MKLGAHVSIRGGVENAPLYGKAATCDVIQIFSKNQLQWKFSPLTDESVSLFKISIFLFSPKFYISLHTYFY